MKMKKMIRKGMRIGREGGKRTRGRDKGMLLNSTWKGVFGGIIGFGDALSHFCLSLLSVTLSPKSNLLFFSFGDDGDPLFCLPLFLQTE